MNFINKINHLTWQNFDLSSTTEDERLFYSAVKMYLHQDEVAAERILKDLLKKELAEDLKEVAESLLSSILFWQNRFDEAKSMKFFSEPEIQPVLSIYTDPFTRFEIQTPLSVFPMIKTAHGLPTIEVLINGIPVQMVVDSGAMLTTISQSVAQKCGISLHDFSIKPKNAFNEEIDVDQATIALLELGGLRIENKKCMVLPDEMFDFKSIGSINGTIGWEIIHKMKWSFDFSKKEILLEKSAPTSKEKNLTCDFFPMVRVMINNREIVSGLDTGANQTILGKCLGRTLRPSGKVKHIMAVAGTVRETEMDVVDSLELNLGGKTLQLESVHLRSTLNFPKPHLFTLPCLLGIDLVKNSTLVIDFPNRVVEII